MSDPHATARRPELVELDAMRAQLAPHDEAAKDLLHEVNNLASIIEATPTGADDLPELAARLEAVRAAFARWQQTTPTRPEGQKA